MAPAFEPIQQSLLSWVYNSLGFKYTLALPFAAVASSALVLLVCTRGKGSFVGPTLVLLVSVPFLIGLFAGLEGVMASYRVIAMSSSQPHPSELAQAISMSLVAPMVGMLLMVPGFGIATLSGIVRSLASSSTEELPRKG